VKDEDEEPTVKPEVEMFVTLGIPMIVWDRHISNKQLLDIYNNPGVYNNPESTKLWCIKCDCRIDPENHLIDECIVSQVLNS
jgi:hypothetical protein